MDRDKLTELKNAAEQKSLALNDRRTELQKELDDITTELVRLQGDYRTYEQILAEFVDHVEPSTPTVTNIPVTDGEDKDGSSTTD